ncbi:hypothetical protein [Rhizobium sp. 768_B6_N1_8]|uniref:hypothetical protein n=1 Tax=unclassified Rhizobium TaxID=2613769 RepID=UPI003F1F82DF
MDAITARQRQALKVLARRHDDYPDRKNFATAHLGEGTTALLRKLIPHGLVEATRGGSGFRQWFSITEAGRELMKETT